MLNPYQQLFSALSNRLRTIITDKLKEQKIINDLQLKINKQKDKVSKKVTRQKILLGAFLIDALENDRVDGLRDYTAKNLPKYLTKDIDKDLLKGLVESLGGVMSNEDKKDDFIEYNS